jgi:phosphatidylserine/phosphatidylglycerophosphate/cardiolipin synthase-like enzyme
MTELLSLASRLAEHLPHADVLTLAQASRAGPAGIQTFRAGCASPMLRQACKDVSRLLKEHSPDYVAGALASAATAVDRARRHQTIDVVWTGPDSGSGTGRLTAAVVVGLISEATTEVLLVSYAAHSEPSVEHALADAVARGVDVTLVLERHVDNPSYSFTGPVYPDLPARRLSWPSSHRLAGASLHAKVIVVDEKTALVGSANLTSWAIERNLECGILIRGGDQPRAIRRHVERLAEKGVLLPM